MDYIKRSVVVKKVMETKWESGSDGAVAMEIVAATPAADVAPVTHGEWIEDDYSSSVSRTHPCAPCLWRGTSGRSSSAALYCAVTVERSL